MNIGKYMKHDVISIPATSTIREADSVFVKHHIGLLAVVVQLRGLLSLEFPDFVNFVPDVDFVHDFGVVEPTRPQKY